MVISLRLHVVAHLPTNLARMFNSSLVRSLFAKVLCLLRFYHVLIPWLTVDPQIMVISDDASHSPCRCL